MSTNSTTGKAAKPGGVCDKCGKPFLREHLYASGERMFVHEEKITQVPPFGGFREITKHCTVSATKAVAS